jgi:hypothetical protein
LERDELLSVLLVVDDETTGTAGWSVLVSFMDLLSVDSQTYTIRIQTTVK